jgi:hypothetical protein
VGEQVTEEGRVLREQRLKVEGGLGRHQLIQADLTGRYLCPVSWGHMSVVRVGAAIAHSFEDH